MIEGLQILRTLWRLLNSRQRRRFFGLHALSIAMALSTLCGMAAIMPFFAALSDSEAVSRSALARLIAQLFHLNDLSVLPLLGAAFVGAVLIANAINLFGLVAINRFSTDVGESLYSRLFLEYLHRGYEFHASRGSTLLASKVQEGARVTSGIVQYALVLSSNLVTIAFVAAAVIASDPLAATAATVILGSSYAAFYGYARARLWRNGSREHELRNERARTVSDSFAAIKEVSLLGAEHFFAARFARQSRGISKAGASTYAIAQTPKYMLECATVACLVAVALYLRGRGDIGSSWVGQLTFVGFAAYRLLPALHQAFTALVNIRNDRAAFASVETDLGPPRTDRQFSDGCGSALRHRREIRICEVTFRYSQLQSPALSEVSLVIPAGAIVGFKGANGSGKTTLLDIVSGLLQPQSGHMEIDGVRLGRENIRAWQAGIAYVPQQVILIEATLAENIAFGVPHGEIDERRLRAAARAACLTDCIAGFPSGYQERVGLGGRGLSGGERQRVAIARALYRDAPILLLDEATSSLDDGRENDIGEMLHGLRGTRTILIVAHRMKALSHCDVVYELRAGKIAAHAAPLLSGVNRAGNG